MINVNVFSEERAWTKKLKNYNLFFKKICKAFPKKYQFLDKIFLRVLKNNPDKMPEIFFAMFKAPSSCVIKFLSNKSNIFEDINIIGRMPKLIFMRALFQ